MENLSLKTLADLYNFLAEKPVAKFKDKATGQARLQALMDEHGFRLVDADGVAALEPIEIEPTTPVEQPPVVESAPVVEDTTSEDRIAANYVADGDAADAAKEVARAGRVSKLMGKRITLISDENPKRKGSATAKRFALYKTGMTSDEYMALCLEQKLGTTREVLSDLAYDSRKLFIKLA